MIIDSHCHLDKLNYEKNNITLDDVVQNALNNGVSHILSVCVKLDEFEEMLNMIKGYENIFASCGVHPLDIKDPIDTELLFKFASNDKVIAIGETGLDYYYDKTNSFMQQDSFRKHIDIAKKIRKPLIIHTRSARKDTIDILINEKGDDIGGVLHCFTESYEMAKKAIDLGFYISISGIVTFKKAHELQDVVKKLPLDSLLVETDSPYLAPVPHRGKENQPAYVKHVTEYIAKLKDLSFDEVAEFTTRNFNKLFLKS